MLSATLLPVLGVPTVVTMHGRDVPGPGVPRRRRWWQRAIEMFGIVVAQTMSHGVPVDPGDAAADEPGRRALGERGRRRAEATFAWDAGAAGYEDVLRRAATRARPGAAVVQR